jgi:hypothetical protein
MPYALKNISSETPVLYLLIMIVNKEKRKKDMRIKIDKI